mmetsp:Transcript_3018/g.3323  ORF Transcript_3018/g.3323 Transcript_3018/m.3323 type:complete len:101 (-) Transcript_3018:1396-1698(-)
MGTRLIRYLETYAADRTSGAGSHQFVSVYNEKPSTAGTGKGQDSFVTGFRFLKKIWAQLRKKTAPNSVRQASMINFRYETFWNRFNNRSPFQPFFGSKVD